MDSRLRAEIESPTNAASSNEFNLAFEMTFLSLENWRIPARCCKSPDMSSPSGSFPVTTCTRPTSPSCDKLNTELTRSLVVESTKGFHLSTIGS
ncbi:hypothetical protein FH972_005994 [Carpinus fangiana]|uniref:Uncharacterized protein n=1 Tax=Carpinus fangiana TaxID=176857 RepID=A0A5N6QTV6_9ROSI|nr:hypothetical protein FH972_005994 [Carpinus fangiana]